MQAATFGVQDVSMGLMSEEKKEKVPAAGKGVQLALAPTLAVPDALPHKEKMGLVGVKGAPAPSPAASAGNSSMTGDAVLEACALPMMLFLCRACKWDAAKCRMHRIHCCRAGWLHQRALTKGIKCFIK